MTIKTIPHHFTVCKVADYSMTDFSAEYCFAGKTDEENSLVCMTSDTLPNTVKREDGWRGFRIEGELDFSLVGIMARISTVLAENGIAIFALSTYNTDYIFVKEADFDKSAGVLRDNNYCVI